MLGLGIVSILIGLSLTGYMMLKAFDQLKDEELDALRKKYFEVSGKKI